MKKLSSLIFIFLASLTALFAQKGDYDVFFEECSAWGREDVESQVTDGLEELFDYQRQRLLPLFENAKKKYIPVIVYEACIDWTKYLENGDIPIHLESNKMPFDLFYFDQRGNIKLTIYMDEGKIQLFDTSFPSLYVGYERKEKRAFHRILRINPDLIFRWEGIEQAYLFIKDNELYVYDVLPGRKVPARKYFSQNAEEIQKLLDFYDKVRSGTIGQM